MLINTFPVAVANSGTALPGAGSPWTYLSGAGANHALAQLPGSAVVTPCTRFAGRQWTPAIARPLAVEAAGLPVDIRKQYVHMTRVNAGGDGASGPHPEREPA